MIDESARTLATCKGIIGVHVIVKVMKMEEVRSRNEILTFFNLYFLDGKQLEKTHVVYADVSSQKGVLL